MIPLLFFPSPPCPVLYYPNLILMLLGDLLFSFFDILCCFSLLGLNYLGFLRRVWLVGLGMLLSL